MLCKRNSQRNNLRFIFQYVTVFAHICDCACYDVTEEPGDCTVFVSPLPFEDMGTPPHTSSILTMAFILRASATVCTGANLTSETNLISTLVQALLNAV